eukprot:m.282729 g.282729  ORF g.282729 m.282729 type:complete len:243 (-) comp19863_c0_seq1:257-985(-)
MASMTFDFDTILENAYTSLDAALKKATDAKESVSSIFKGPRTSIECDLDKNITPLHSTTSEVVSTSIMDIGASSESVPSSGLNGIEKLHTLPPVGQSDRQKRAQSKRERKVNDNAGKGWFNLPATQITPEVETTLKLLKLRHVFDSKVFMKKDKRKVLPKYFQIGKVVDGAADYYSKDSTRGKGKSTLADELLSDLDFKRYHKKKFTEIQAKRASTSRHRGTKHKKGQTGTAGKNSKRNHKR